MTLRSCCTGAALVACLAFQALPKNPVHASTRSASRATFTIPRGNVAWTRPVLDARHVVYGAAVPLFHRPECVSCGPQPFANFHVRVYVRDYRRRSTSITVSKPRLLFDGPRGTQVAADTLAGGWLVYDTDTPQDQWRLYARNVDTGRVILLDSPAMERLPSRFLHASTDGRTVVWQSWTRLHGRTISVIRSYTLATGRRRLLLTGGSGTDYFYGYPQISGNHVIIEKGPGSHAASQLFLENLATRHIRALTPRADRTPNRPSPGRSSCGCMALSPSAIRMASWSRISRRADETL